MTPAERVGGEPVSVGSVLPGFPIPFDPLPAGLRGRAGWPPDRLDPPVRLAAPEPGTRAGRPRPVGHLVGLVALLGAGSLAAALVLAAGHASPAAWRLALGFLLLAVGDLPLVRLRYAVDFGLGEAGVLLAVSLLPMPWVPLLAAPASLATRIPAQRGASVKAINNVATFTLGAAAAAGCAHLVAGSRPLDRVSAASFGALVCAVLAFMFVTTLLQSVVIARATGDSVAAVLGGNAAVVLVQLVGNTAIGLAIVALARTSPDALLVIPPVLFLLLVSNRSSARVAQDRDTWRELEQAARGLSRLEGEEVAVAAVAYATRLFHVDGAELVVCREGEQPRLTRVRSHQVLASGEPADFLPGELAEPPEPKLLGNPEHGQCWSVPLQLRTGRTGSLRIQAGPRAELGSRERQILRTYAHSVSVALINSALHEEVLEYAEGKAYEAEHDALTGLGNRVFLRARAPAIFAAGRGRGRLCALVLLDLDQFKQVNDTLGHGAGDDLLGTVARRLAHLVRPGDLVVRLGGDEFAVLLDDLPDVADAEARAGELVRGLQRHLTVQGIRLAVDSSAGVACFPLHAEDIDTLLRCAEVAMYQAKRAPGSVQLYRRERDDASVERLALSSELRAAIEQRQLELHYQPKLWLATGELAGLEALVRWRHPVRGLLLPAEFIPVVERTGLVHEFTQVVLEQAITECAAWAGFGTPAAVAVNLSARNLHDRELPGTVAEALRRSALPADRLIVEITETSVMSELEVVDEVLGELRALGVRISVDDFGTGYSSLAVLQRLPLHEVKVDRSFIRELLDSSSAAAIVQATVQLAHALGLRVVAEGVDDARLVAPLRAMGCDLAQGFLFARAMPAAELRERLYQGWVPPASLGPDGTLGDRASRVLRFPGTRTDGQAGG